MPDSWKQLRVQEGVTMRIPQDMKSFDPLGDYQWRVEAYGNKDLALMIFYEPLVPKALSESQKRELYSCEREQSVLEYRESTIEVDGKKAIIRITKPDSERSITSICFPVAENVKVPLHIVAFCSDDSGLETAQQIFRSVRFIE